MTNDTAVFDLQSMQQPNGQTIVRESSYIEILHSETKGTWNPPEREACKISSSRESSLEKEGCQRDGWAAAKARARNNEAEEGERM
eukprot:scaffold5030_cov128-Skeletonema_marinoi.AAC.1